MAGGVGGIARRFTGRDPARMAVGLLLLSAAGLKAHQPTAGSVLGSGFLDRAAPVFRYTAR